MSYNHDLCPLCATPFSLELIVAKTVVCSHCSWSGPRDYRIQKQKEKRNRQLMIVAKYSFLAGIAAMGIGMAQWGQDFTPYLSYSVTRLTGNADLQDHLRMASICDQKKVFNCSAKSYARALDLDSENHQALMGIGVALSMQGNYQDALTYLDKYFQTQPENPNAMVMAHYAVALDEAGRSDEAIQMYYQSLSIEPDIMSVVDRLLATLEKVGHYDQALSLVGYYMEGADVARRHIKKHVSTIQTWWSQVQSQGKKDFQMASFFRYHYIPTQIGSAKEPEFFVIDQNSPYLTIDSSFLERLNASDYQVVGKAEMRTSANAPIDAQRVILKSVKIGAWQLENVSAISCKDCGMVVGKQLLKSFKAETADNNKLQRMTLQKL